jgi:hypothetical protein
MITFKDAAGVVSSPCGSCSTPVSKSGDGCTMLLPVQVSTQFPQGAALVMCAGRADMNSGFQQYWPASVGCSSLCVCGACSAKTCNSATGLAGLFDGVGFQGGSKIPIWETSQSNPISIAVSDPW